MAQNLLFMSGSWVWNTVYLASQSTSAGRGGWDARNFQISCLSPFLVVGCVRNNILVKEVLVLYFAEVVLSTLTELGFYFYLNN